MKKISLILIFINLYLGATILTSNNTVENANSILIKLKEKNISEPKLTLDKHNIDFNKLKDDTYYAVVPISYYKKFKDYKIIISYIKENKKIFKGIPITVIDGKYKSEVINVDSSKVTLNEKNKKRTTIEYNEAMKIYNKETNLSYINKKFIYPLNSKITSDFGKKRVYNGKLKSYHSGTDFRASIGTPIKATNTGKVVLAKNRFYAGNSIIIDHGQGIYSCYYHLSKMNFKVGDFVKQGEIIGLSGNTGRSTGPHLHFSIRVHSILVDPLQFIEIMNNNLFN